MRAFLSLIKESALSWYEDRAMRMGAALAYYSVFALAPLLVLVIAIAGLVFGEQKAREYALGQVERNIGASGKKAVQSMLEQVSNPRSNRIATIIAIITTLAGASGFFAELQDSLNIIWRVTAPSAGIWSFIKNRLLTFAMILVIGFLLLAALVLTGALHIAGRIVPFLKEDENLPFWYLANSGVTFIITTLLFAMILKILPDVTIHWRDVWLGAAVTAILFAIGKYLIGLYLAHAAITSAYGAAASLVVILTWFYYSAQILLFGAEFTRVFAVKRGRHVFPRNKAVLLSDAELARQGLRRSPEYHSPVKTSRLDH
jgi:membrane protein